MKLKSKIIFISLILLVLFSITCVSAAQDVDANSTVTASEVDVDEVSSSSDNNEVQSAESDLKDSSELGASDDSKTANNDKKAVSASKNANNQVLKAKTTPKLYIANRTVFVKDYTNGYDYLMILKDSKDKALAGKKLAITFNGRTCYRTTDNRGWASIVLKSSAVAGDHKVSVKFLGDSEYKAVNQKAVLRVVKEPVNLVSTDRTIYLYQIYDGYSYPMIFKDRNGHNQAKKIVYAEFNGKKFKGCTDDRGWFYFNLSCTHTGSYKVTITSAEDRYYKAGIVKRTINVVMNKNNPYGKKTKKVWINADSGSDDMKNAVADLLRKQGWTVHVGQTYSNAHYTDYFKVPSDYVYITLYNGFCAGTIREAYSSSIQNTLKKKGVTLVVMWDTRKWTNPQGMKPYRYGDFTGYNAARAWDDNFSVGDPSINNVADWLKSKNAIYCASPSASGLVDQFMHGGYFASTGK